MKLSEFQKPAPPVSREGTPAPATSGPGPSPASATAEADTSASEAPQEEQNTSVVTPSGIEIQYAWAPRRLYRLNRGDLWEEVPSVTTVLGVLDKSAPLIWWSQGIACEGIVELAKRGLIETESGTWGLQHTGGSAATKESLVALLTEERLSVNHQRDKAADRGVNVHGALEAWCEHRILANPAVFPATESGYIQGLRAFQDVLAEAEAVESVAAELMVGSLQHQYAGRFDLVLTLSKPVEVCTRLYPKRKPKIEEIPAGRYLVDLKTRAKASVYPTNYMQLEAYEAAAVECGYEPTDYRAVLVVTPEGGYQFSVNQDYCFEDFLAARACYQVMNEREVLRVLREELDAKEVA